MKSKYIYEVKGMLARFDKGDSIWSIELGGLGPGYEQAIQLAAIAITRACKDLEDIKDNDKKSTERFRAEADLALHEADKALGGLSGAQVGAATWLAFQWCFHCGPKGLQEKLKARGETNRQIQVSKAWPRLAEANP